MTAPRTIRWGILGTAAIARRAFIPAVRESTGGEVSAVSSRTEERARAFAAELDIPRAYSSYERALADSELDAIYIPLPNTLHAEWIEKAAAAGKHVFCEKPLTMTVAEARKAVATCRAGNVLLAEAFVYLYHRQSQRIRSLIDSGALGAVRHTDATFHFTLGDGPNIRLQPEVGGGALTDVGCYVLSWTRFVMGELPTAVAATAVRDAASGVDASTVATLRFTDGRTANVSSGIRVQGGQRAVIYGTKGVLEVTQPFHPQPGEAALHLRRNGKTENHSVDIDKAPFTEAISTFQECIRNRTPLPIPAPDLIEQARIMTACRTAAAEDRWVQLTKP